MHWFSNWTVVILGLSLAACGSKEYTIPATQSIARILKFDKPVVLTARPASPLDGTFEKWIGRPLTGFEFADHDRSDYSYSVYIYRKGAAFGSARQEFEAQLSTTQSKLSKSPERDPIPYGIREIDGRKILCFIIGFGAGGETTAILFPHRKEPIEILVLQNIDYDRRRPTPLATQLAIPSIHYWDAFRDIEDMIETR